MNSHRTGRRPDFAVFGSRSGLLAVALLVAIGASPSHSHLAASAAQLPQDQQLLANDISSQALAEIDALMREKESRTPIERKIDSQLIYELRMARGQSIAEGVTQLATNLSYDTDNKLIIDVAGDVSDAVLEQLKTLGAEIVDADEGRRSVRLRANLDQIEVIAALPEVIFVQPKQDAITSHVGATVAERSIHGDTWLRSVPDRLQVKRAALAAYLRSALTEQQDTSAGTGQGSKSSEGDLAHRAFATRGTFHVDGTGVKVGVLSDGVTALGESQTLGDLGLITVLPGQTGTGNEGTAMLEIIHDLAPGAQLYFATAFTSLTGFAQNIRGLRAAGCDIIVDDVGYFVETPFQDGQAPGVVSTTNAGVVIQAVKDVTAGGALYLSSAANSGNLNDATSGTWEGDFADGGATAAPLPAGRLHSFGVQTFDVLSAASTSPITLHWSDPLGASTNDYDLFRLNTTGTAVLASSTNLQTGTQDPYEQVTGTGAAASQRIVIVKSGAAAGRFLHLSTNRGVLSIATQGETHGHAATSALSSFGVAAANAGAVSPNPFGSSSVVETFSSDGPRRIFFNADGSAITPGNVSSTGGQVLQKPDFTAADGVAVTGVGGFPTPFFGTSAAAPHAAAIAALIKSANLSLTPAQIRTALFSGVIDIEAAGVDRDSGAGIIMAYPAVQSLGVTGTAFLATGTIVATERPGNGNGVINVGEGAQILVPLNNLGTLNATGIVATLTTSTPGVILTLPAQSSYSNIAAGASGTNTTPFLFTMASNASCPLIVDFTLTVSYTGGPAPAAIPFQVQTGPPPFTITTTLDGVSPTASAGVTTATGQQIGRLTRNGAASVCGSPKIFPGNNDVLAGRQFDAYTISTCSESVASCATVALSGTPLGNLFSAAYSPSFLSTNVQTNYKADAGVSGAATSYAFDIVGGAQTFGIDVHEVTVGAGLGTQYTLTVSGACAGACATPNQLPIARARDVTVTAGAGGTASASIDNGSSDPDGDALTITQSPAGPYSIGTTSVRLTVVDTKGATSQATANVTVIGTSTMSLDKTALAFGATSAGTSFVAKTSDQIVRLTQNGFGTVTWTASSDQPWLTVSPASGTGSATLTVSVSFHSSVSAAGTASGTIALSFTGAGNTAGPITVGLKTIANGASTGPIGSFDTPTDNATGVTGSTAVTGWAIDDVEVTQVRILRDPVAGEGTAQVFIGNAVFVDGARSDVATANPTLPRNTRAGWGYLMLTNFLPSQGNGTFKLYAYADDADGHTTLLGSKTITCSNSTSFEPFGAIDTPGQGEVVSGAVYNNFGWVLVRGPALAYPPHGTVSVYIDSLPVGVPSGWVSRADLTALFPVATYPGVTNAAAAYTFNTTTLTNGVHTIFWVVTADNNRTAGIGSRYFTVANGSGVVGSGVLGSVRLQPDQANQPDQHAITIDAPALMSAGPRTSSLSLQDEVNAAPLNGAGLTGRRGYAMDTPFQSLSLDRNGRSTLQGEELDRFELQLRANDASVGGHYTGYLRVGFDLGGLPVGSHLDPESGAFTWQPGVGFVHAYDLVFVRWDQGRAIARQEVRVVLNAKGSNRVGPQVVIDIPSSVASGFSRPPDVVQPFVVAGWAIDADAAGGTGIDTLHVWAYPTDGGDPVFVGVATYGGARPDVAAIFGDRFRDSGYGLVVDSLPPGAYDLAVFAWSTATGGFVPAKVVRVTVR